MNDAGAFFQALRERDLARVRAHLDATPALVSEREDGGTALHFAAIHDHLMESS